MSDPARLSEEQISKRMLTLASELARRVGVDVESVEDPPTFVELAGEWWGDSNPDFEHPVLRFARWLDEHFIPLERSPK